MLVNLAYLLNKPTGTTTYALNLVPSLQELNPLFLATPACGLKDYYAVPANLTAEFGMAGHVRRLLWTQFRLPTLCQKNRKKQQASDLLFSPITEAPVGTSCRFVVTVHDLTPLRFPTISRSLNWLYRYYVPQVLQAAEHIICDSQATADDIIQFYGLSAQKITPILLAHDAQNFRPLNIEQQNYFLVLGRHAPYKNVAAAISAFHKLPKNNEFELWIAGPFDQRYTPKLTSQVNALHLADRVKFLNYIPYTELPQLLSQSLALIFPSLWEGFGLPALEAMACGTPVIASNLASIPEVTSDAAMLINPYKSDELTQAMIEIAKDPQLRQQLSQTGIKRSQKFSWDKTGKATVTLLRNYL